jgi:hypothetical protein
VDGMVYLQVPTAVPATIDSVPEEEVA